ncbi:MAG: HD domain-containing protein [Candidatus Eremiobacteraeota bacterium]|nr:HD domain-containing protein [Candidatus Eremiobacteraeota bacterium]
MKPSLQSKMFFWVWGTTAIVFALMMYVNFDIDRQHVIDNLKENAGITADVLSSRFEQEFLRASNIPKMTAIKFETINNVKDKDIDNYLKEVVKKNDNIYGACIAFEPHAFNLNKESYAPYYYHKNGKVEFSQLATSRYNYFEKEWYEIPKEKGKAMWSEPYYDEGGGNVMMTTYSAPFYSDGKFAGIATSDISLEKLTDDINKIKILETGYVFIISKKGYFLSFPNKILTLKGNLFDYDNNLAKKMTSGKSGVARGSDPHLNKDSWIVFHPIEFADFSIGIVYPHDEIMQNIYQLQHRNIAIGAIGLLILLIIIILLSKSISRPLSELARDAKKIEDGNLDFEITVETRTYEVSVLEHSMNKMVKSLKEYIESLKIANAAKERLFVSSIKALANAIEARDPYTRGHSDRVTEYSVKIAEKMGLNEDEVRKIEYASLLHDIGKIEVRESVLNKPGRLTSEEFGIMKQHPVYGAKIMEPVDEFSEMVPYMYHHHESYDGKGYPGGLKKDKIPLASRIIAVADTFDAMTSNRPYRKALPVEVALEEIEKKIGTQFDPDAAKAFLEIAKTDKDWLLKIIDEQLDSTS